MLQVTQTLICCSKEKDMSKSSNWTNVHKCFASLNMIPTGARPTDQQKKVIPAKFALIFVSSFCLKIVFNVASNHTPSSKANKETHRMAGCPAGHPTGVTATPWLSCWAATGVKWNGFHLPLSKSQCKQAPSNRKHWQMTSSTQARSQRCQ